MAHSGISAIPATTISLLQTSASINQLTVVGWQFVGQPAPPKLLGVVTLLPEPTNPMDAGAVLVLEDGIKVGYLLRRTIAPVHFLLANFLTKLRDESDYHPSEMGLPLLINLIEADDTGKAHGSLKVVGLDRNGEAEDHPITMVPVYEVARHVSWEAELRVVDSPDKVVHRRRIDYPTPVSAGLIRSYCIQRYPDLEYVSATPVTTNPV